MTNTTAEMTAFNAFEVFQGIKVDTIREDAILEAIEALAVLLNNPWLLFGDIQGDYQALAREENIELYHLIANCETDEDGLISNRMTVLRLLAETL